MSNWIRLLGVGLIAGVVGVGLRLCVADSPADNAAGPAAGNSQPAQDAASANPASDSSASPTATSSSDPNIVYLSPDHNLWIDKRQHEVVMKGKIAVREGNLEMLACPEGTKEHESIVAVSTKALPVHAALIALGAAPGHPSHYDGKTEKFTPASGTEIEVFVRWTDSKGKHDVPGQEMIRNIKTHKQLEYPWVFGGSFVEVENGQKFYQGDYGDFICVANFPTATMDLPIDSPKAWSDHLFEPFTERIPPRGTPVELALRPNLKTNAAGKTPPAKP
jgi:hypothetical protein